jgi:hypothetical protein
VTSLLEAVPDDPSEVAASSELARGELGSTEPGRLRIVFSATSDEAEWDSQIAEMISSGHAGPDDEFMCIGWMLRPRRAWYRTRIPLYDSEREFQ